MPRGRSSPQTLQQRPSHEIHSAEDLQAHLTQAFISGNFIGSLQKLLQRGAVGFLEELLAGDFPPWSLAGHTQELSEMLIWEHRPPLEILKRGLEQMSPD